jgi:hypothetical protein
MLKQGTYLVKEVPSQTNFYVGFVVLVTSYTYCWGRAIGGVPKGTSSESRVQEKTCIEICREA